MLTTLYADIEKTSKISDTELDVVKTITDRHQTVTKDELLEQKAKIDALLKLFA